MSQGCNAIAFVISDDNGLGLRMMEEDCGKIAVRNSQCDRGDGISIREGRSRVVGLKQKSPAGFTRPGLGQCLVAEKSLSCVRLSQQFTGQQPSASGYGSQGHGFFQRRSVPRFDD